ncbi:MAG: Adaptive-response sensory-kinase SasA [Anaerolineae bacterium]|nr:Adaptive-response sensory-kinase SasA [Anaerolineae bacterium]
MTAENITPEQLINLNSIPIPSSKSSNSKLGNSFLRVLANAGRGTLAQLLGESQYQSGDIIFKEGDPGNTMYIVWSGRVAVVKGDFSAPTVLGSRGVGEVIGEMALLENEVRSASVIALENVRLLTITRESFERLLSQNPAMGLGILSMLSARLRASDDARKTSSRAESQLVKQVSQLQTEKQKLMELERIRQDTIDLIVHDLRHPISSLFGAVKILEMVLPEEVLEENKQLIDIANSNCDLLQLMVESLLDVARMEEGNFYLNIRSINLHAFVQESVNRVRFLAGMENISLETDVSVDLAVIDADEEKLHRILGNLLHNAIKFTPGGGQIQIVVTPNGNKVRFAVIDTGPGIPADSRAHIFDRFVQLDGDRPRRGGFGLGLAFCKIAVEAHGGTIWVDPGVNDVGSKFTFEIPLSAETGPISLR